MPQIVHLVDDTTPGGVMRVLHHICNCPKMAQLGTHRILPVSRDGQGLVPRDADLIVSHLSVSWRRLPALMQLRAAHADRVMIHVEHSYTEAFVAQNVLRRARFRTLLTTAYSLFDRVVSVSAAQGAWMRDRGLVAPEQLRVIPSAVDLAPFLALPEVTGRPRVIGAIGRFEAQKGFDTLIAAFRGCGDAALRLEIFGDGGDRAKLLALAAGDQRIRFRGWVDPVTAISSVDVVAMPSRWEAYGLVALEARAAGRPLLAARVDGLRDHVEEGAIAVEGHGTGAWRAALEQLDRHHGGVDIARARRMAATASDRFAMAWADLVQDVMQMDQAAQAA